MRSREDIEAYIDRSGLPLKELDERTWLLRSSLEGDENIVVQIAEPLLLFRVKVMELGAEKDTTGLYLKLLQLNASDLVHGSYGVADDAIVLSSALLLESADYGEFQGALDEITMALTNHYQELAPFRTGAQGAGH